MNFRKDVIKEYFETTANLLQYEDCAEKNEIERRVLGFILRCFGECAGEEAYLKAIEETKIVATVKDILLADSILESYSSTEKAVISVKSDVIRDMQISHLKYFDTDIAVLEAEKKASAGYVYSCKLWAFLNYFGEGVSKNRICAYEIWKMLAISGDTFAIKELEMCLRESGNTDEADMWKNTGKIIESSEKTFCPVVSGAIKRMYGKREVDTAEIILCLQGTFSEKKCIDRSRVYYALNSSDSIETKLKRLSGKENFYCIMHHETQDSSFGF